MVVIIFIFDHAAVGAEGNQDRIYALYIHHVSCGKTGM